MAKQIAVTFKRLGCGSSRTYTLRSIAGSPFISYTNLMGYNSTLRVNDKIDESELEEICKDERYKVRVSG